MKSVGVPTWANVFRDLQLEFGAATPFGLFQIWSGETRPRHGKGHGAHGVRHQSIVGYYGRWLQECEAYFRNNGRKCQEIVPVVICDLESFHSGPMGAVIPLENELGMLLPSQIRHASQEGELGIMEATAKHECVHLFNLYERPLGRRNNEAWGWFDEATATYFESRLATGSKDWLRFAAAHQFVPECPAHRTYGNHGCALVHRLVQKFGEGLLHRLWTESVGCTSRPNISP